MPKIKICGLTSEQEAGWLLEEAVDYAGMVMFFPKSKRNNTVENAKKILRVFYEANRMEEGRTVKSVAVTVSPTARQVEQLEVLGFDLIQVHGSVEEEIFETTEIPVIRAIHDEADWEQFLEWNRHEMWRDRLVGVLFDAKEPGSGETFDWKRLHRLSQIEQIRSQKLCFLAGGLHSENIKDAIRDTNPDVVDVSSGVEFSHEQVGKDRSKIKAFVKAVRE